MNRTPSTTDLPLFEISFPVYVIDTQKCTHQDDIEANRELIKNPYALILQGTVSGTIPLVFIEIIQERTNRGFPTFIVGSGCYVPNGTAGEKYENHVEAERVGAIALRKLNLNQIGALSQFILERVQAGERGDKLISSVLDFNDSHPDIVSTAEATALRNGELLNINL